MPQRKCHTCAKREVNRKREQHCAVLDDMIGKSGDCWAWDSDPEWKAKLIKAAIDYMGSGRKIPDD